MDRPLHLLWSVEHALRLETREIQSRLGLSAAQLWALWKLSENPRASIGALAQLLGTHQSSASVAVKRLEGRGLIVRKRLPSDRRQIELELSDAGRSMLTKLPFVLVRARLEKALLAMPDRDRRELSRLLESWLRSAAIPT